MYDASLSLLLEHPKRDLEGEAEIGVAVAGTSSEDGIALFYDGDTNEFVLLRTQGSESDRVAIDAGAFVEDDELVVAASWSSDEFSIVLESAASKVVATAVGWLLEGDMGPLQMGADSGVNHATAEVQWFMLSTEVLDDVYELLEAEGNEVPDWRDYSRQTDISLLWDGIGADHEIMSNVAGETVAEA